MAAAGDEQQVRLRAPAVGGAGVERFGQALEQADPGVRAPVDVLQRVVVAVVRGGPLVDLPVGADANLDPLPVVRVIALRADHRDAAQGGRVGVVGEVLEVEVSLPAGRAVGAGGFAVGGRAGPAVDDVDEGGHPQSRRRSARPGRPRGRRRSRCCGSGGSRPAPPASRPRRRSSACGGEPARRPRSRRRRSAPARRRMSRRAPRRRGCARRSRGPAPLQAPAPRPPPAPRAATRRAAAGPTHSTVVCPRSRPFPDARRGHRANGCRKRRKTHSPVHTLAILRSARQTR